MKLNLKCPKCRSLKWLVTVMKQENRNRSNQDRKNPRRIQSGLQQKAKSQNPSLGAEIDTSREQKSKSTQPACQACFLKKKKKKRHGLFHIKLHNHNHLLRSFFRMENKAPQNKKVTDYFPIRRSNRKTKMELKSEQHRHLDDLIKNGTEEGMQVKHIEGKGRGVFSVSGFKKGDFVVEYHGDLLDLAEAKIREAQYAEDPQMGCYMYYFQYQSKTYCVDATKETSRLGRLINHSKTGNCQTRLHPIDGTPHLILVASRDIKADEELLYDYGDRSKASILAHPWLKY
uniref:[histone H4]-lysine(20) N-methyltransferase n=1 Tax=Amphilophus citrinellus TaxID=61819 RepID=A0A3Q0QXH3_AMPCI